MWNRITSAMISGASFSLSHCPTLDLLLIVKVLLYTCPSLSVFLNEMTYVKILARCLTRGKHIHFWSHHPTWKPFCRSIWYIINGTVYTVYTWGKSTSRLIQVLGRFHVHRVVGVGCCFLAGFWLGFFSASGGRPYSSVYRPFIFEASNSGLSPSYASCSSHLF